MRSIAFASPRATATLPAVRASSLYFVHNCAAVGALDAGKVPFDLQPVARPALRARTCRRRRRRPSRRVPAGISKTSRTPSRLRAALSSKLLTRAPNTGGCATTATFIPGRSRSKPNFSEPSHLGRLSSRRTLFPTSRNSDGFLSRTLAGTGFRAASPASSAYFAD